MTKFTRYLSGVAIAALTATASYAAETLTISSWAGPTHGINSMLFPKLIEMIETA